MTGTDRLRELTEAWTALQAQNEWLHARITELEAEIAMLRGTVARPGRGRPTRRYSPRRSTERTAMNERSEIRVALDRLYVRARNLEPDAKMRLAERMFHYAMELGASVQVLEGEDAEPMINRLSP